MNESITYNILTYTFVSTQTDPENADYKLEAGATRNFEALRTAEILAKKEEERKKEEEDNNPMKLLENRTKASQKEMENLEILEEIKTQNSKNAQLSHEEILKIHQIYDEKLQELQFEEDEQLVKLVKLNFMILFQIIKKFFRSLFTKKETVIKRLSDNEEEEETVPSTKKFKMSGSQSSLLLSNTVMN